MNEAIKKNVEVVLEEMTPEKAYEEGAVGVFSGKYGEIVKVYTVPGYSKEICGGPHAKNTGELVSLMTFNKPRKGIGKMSEDGLEWELGRFCNALNTNVVGGASKLFKYFINERIQTSYQNPRIFSS